MVTPNNVDFVKEFQFVSVDKFLLDIINLHLEEYKKTNCLTKTLSSPKKFKLDPFFAFPKELSFSQWFCIVFNLLEFKPNKFDWTSNWFNLLLTENFINSELFLVSVNTTSHWPNSNRTWGVESYDFLVNKARAGTYDLMINCTIDNYDYLNLKSGKKYVIIKISDPKTIQIIKESVSLCIMDLQQASIKLVNKHIGEPKQNSEQLYYTGILNSLVLNEKERKLFRSNSFPLGTFGDPELAVQVDKCSNSNELCLFASIKPGCYCDSKFVNTNDSEINIGKILKENSNNIFCTIQIKSTREFHVPLDTFQNVSIRFEISSIF